MKYESKKRKEEGAAGAVDKCLNSGCKRPNINRPARTHTHMQNLFAVCVCVLFMCFYVFSLVITQALPEPQGTGKEDKHGLMWSNFLPSENKERENKRKRKPKKIETTLKWDAKCDCLLNHVQKWFKVPILSLLCFKHGELLSPMSFTQPQWGIIGWGIGLWETAV